MKKKNGWYHDTTRGSTSEIRYFCDYPMVNETSWWGPFNTFDKCKRDAIAYHRCDIRDAQGAIGDIRSMKESEGK